MNPKSGPRPRVASDGAAAPARPSQNEILAKIPRDELALVLEQAAETSLSLRQELFEAHDTIDRVHFPLTAMVSLLTLLDNGIPVEVMTIGREGFVGFPLLNHVTTARYKGMCQISGTCLTLDTKAFLTILEQLPDLRRRLHRFAQFANEVAAQSVACNSAHDVEQRLARWLLITADAVGGKTFDITQEFLSQMLAVRRAGVTNAMGALERRGLIEHHYGQVTLPDIEGLQNTSCECYRRIREKAAELLD